MFPWFSLNIYRSNFGLTLDIGGEQKWGVSFTGDAHPELFSEVVTRADGSQVTVGQLVNENIVSLQGFYQDKAAAYKSGQGA